MRRSLATAALGALLLPIGCAWSVPADPGRNSVLRGATAPGGVEFGDAGPAPARAVGGAATDDGARALYVNRCGRCHELYAPTHLSAQDWPAVFRSMAPRAGLFGAERERVAAWLLAHAR